MGPGLIDVTTLTTGGHVGEFGVADWRDPYAWLERYGALAAVVQLQQSDADGDHHWAFTPEHNAVGRIDAERTLAALERSGVAELVLILEVIPAFETDDDTALDELRQSVDYWHSHLRSWGG